MAYSKDYRQMILNKLTEGRSFREISEEYGHSTRTLQNWKKDINRKQRRNPQLKIDKELLLKDIEMYPDAYQHERAVRFNCTGRAIGMVLKKMNISKKKESKPPKG